MKNKKKLFIIGGSAFALVVAIILCIALIPHDNKPVTEPETSETAESKTEVTIIDPDDTESAESEADETDSESEAIVDDGSGLKPIVEDEESQTTSKSETSKADEPIATPVSEHSVTPDKSEDTGGVVIGNNPEPEAYSCGVSGHHCSCAEVHALISNYELEGCQYCGSHSCPSFYATDAWGQTCYDASKCPKYNIKSDPVYYCQDCGKKCGDGQNGTCAVYNIDIECPYCGEHVKAWTCHSCK